MLHIIFILLFYYFGLTAFGLILQQMIVNKRMKGWWSIAVGLCLGMSVHNLLLWLAGSFGAFHLIAWGVPAISLFWSIFTSLRRAKSTFKIQPFLFWLSNHYLSAISFLIIVVASIYLGRSYAEISLGSPIDGVPGLGNWAYKAKILYFHQGVPPNYLTDYATMYGKFSYPPGFPLSCSALYTMAGGINDALVNTHALALHVFSFATLSGLFIQQWKWFGLAAMLGLSGFFLGSPALQVIYSFYAEPMLLFCVVVSLLCFTVPNHDLLALLTAGCAALVKQEGILFMLLMGASIIALQPSGQRRSYLIRFSIIVAFFILPWRLYLWIHPVQDSDFIFSLSHWDGRKCITAWKSVSSLLFHHYFHYGCAYLLSPIVLISAILTKNKRALFLLGIAASMISIYLLSMGFSNVTLSWHLSATPRYLMLPALCVLIALSVLYPQEQTQPILKKP